MGLRAYGSMVCLRLMVAQSGFDDRDLASTGLSRCVPVGVPQRSIRNLEGFGVSG